MAHAPDATRPDPGALCLFLLGSFRLERGGRTVHFHVRKVESLLAFLALYPEAHSREKLAALFWGDVSDEQARLSLRVALSTLRKELGDNLVLADRETIQLNPDYAIWVDAVEFPRSAEDPGAVDLYRGDLLPDCYDDWIMPQRERLRALYLDRLLELVQQARSESRYALAIERARQALAHDPANERAYQHLMFCHAAMGDRTAALKQYDECQRALRDELSVAPSPETLALYEQIKSQAADHPSVQALFTNLPVALTSFVGRQEEMGEVKRLLGTTRLLTLTGAGGCGKTRLAIQVATNLAGRDVPGRDVPGRDVPWNVSTMERRYKDGVWWVDLAPLSDPALVVHAVASVLGMQESSRMPLMAILTNYLRAKDMLLVIDNCEHLLGASAQLIGTLLSACPRLQVMATSREVLNISGEVAWRVPSLALPDVDAERLPPLAQLRHYDAIQLFAERALAASPSWRLAEHSVPAARVCARLDGIPLAIELAAARLRVLSVEQVAERLDDRFNLLTGGSHTALPRHKTLWAAMDWSYNLLSSAESALLRSLVVFAGGWTLEAAEAVAGVDLVSPDAVLGLLTALGDKSLVVIEPGEGETRYKLLETVRQHAREKLLEANELRIYSRRHWDWFLELAEQADPKLHSGEQLEWCERLDREIENLRAALAWSLGPGADDAGAEPALRLAGALAWFWFLRGYWDEGRTWLERSLENRAITPSRAKALVGLGLLEAYVGTPAKCLALYEEGLTLYRQQGNKWGIANAAGFCGARERSDPSRASALFEEARSIAQELNDEWLATATDNLQGNNARSRGNLLLAHSLYESALNHARRAGDRQLIGDVLDNLGGVALEEGDIDRAAAVFTEDLEVRREQGSKNAIATALCGLGEVARRRHDDQQAMTLFKQALALRREMGNTRGIVECLWALGRVAAAEGKYERAARLFGSIESRYEMLAAKNRGAYQVLDAIDRRAYEDDMRAVRTHLDAATAATALAAGRALSPEGAIEYALEN